MPVLTVLEYQNEELKKGMNVALAYGQQLSVQLEMEHFVLLIGTKSPDLSYIGSLGIKKVICTEPEINTGDNRQIATAISKVAMEKGCDYVIFGNTLLAKTTAPRLAVRLQAGYLAGATALPDFSGELKRKVFSGKAYATVSVKTSRKVILVEDFQTTLVNDPVVPQSENIHFDLTVSVFLEQKFTKPAGGIPLSEANTVISGGRGMKGPEHWGLIEELAAVTGAATACSRPVADAGWRPHHEHVGQTGQAIAPNLYIAVGISGAIQHLAGVNKSKVMVVINKDPEAPFFKSADYGIVGDAFEVLPKIIAAVKELA